MNKFMQRVFLVLSGLIVVGCSDMSAPSLGGVMGDNNGDAIHIAESKKNNSLGPLHKYAVSVHVNLYTDARKIDSPRKIGTGAHFVSGMSGNDILLDRDVAVLVTGAMKNRLDEVGFQVDEAQNGNALFELSGVVKELRYDVKARDEVEIVIETSLKETGTGMVIWSGIVVEKNDRFAGVSGNSKKDVANYLSKELGIVTQKTIEAIRDSLVAARPGLFNLTPGAKVISGVTVLTAPTVDNTPVPTPPALQIVPMHAVNGAASVQAAATKGVLLINTKPARASVYLDDVYYGLSPLRLEMAPGVYSISAKLEGYKKVTEKVSVRIAETTEMELSLER